MMLSSNLIRDALQGRNQYIIEREARLGRWRADIATMETEINGGNLTHRKELIELKREMDVVEDQLEKLKEATGDTWEDLKPKADSAWEELSASLEKLKRKLQKNVS